MNPTAERVFSRNIETCKNPVFVIGSPRSGTSVVAWSLAAIDDEFWTAPETDFFYYLFAEDPASKVWIETHIRPDHRSWLIENAVEREEFEEYLGLGLNALMASRAGGRRWIDQTPTYTLIGCVLARMYPGAYFVNVLRDGRSVVHSMLNFMRGKSEDFQQGFADLTWAADFGEACRTWALYAAKGAELCAAYPDRATTLLNEEMSGNPESAFEQTLLAIGARADGRAAAFSRSERINSSFGGAVNANPWDVWSDEQRRTFMEETRSALQHYSSDVLARVRACWPDYEAWYETEPQEQATA